ncbi:hypothetical protein CLF_113015 [Clonorchis sinensis]|uniref:Uncharacterized protein n=1 Tax=Clonorchis sinensis TaxID=79923 RepID=G7YXG6_CLOSI|nr:hypothetical protein CLF_113015 [Clonorchis sinensis]
MIPRSTILAVHRKPDQSTLGSTTEVDESHLHRGKRSVVYQHRPARLSTVFGDAQRATPEAQAETGHVVGQPQSDSTSAADMPENGHTRETTRWSRFGSNVFDRLLKSMNRTRKQFILMSKAFRIVWWRQTNASVEELRVMCVNYLTPVEVFNEGFIMPCGSLPVTYNKTDMHEIGQNLDG